MNPSENLARLQRLLADSDSDLAAECLSLIGAGEVAITASGSADAAHLHRIYERRWRLQQEVTGAEVVGYEHVVEGLARLTGEVMIDSIVTAEADYIVFSEPSGPISGILRSPYHNLAKLKALRSEWEGKGVGSSGARFVQGALVETWGAA